MPKKQIICFGWKNARVERNQNDKWYVSLNEFAGNHYPKYCGGFFLLMTNDAISSLYKQSFREKFFWIDDIWLTGIVAARAGISIVFEENLIVVREHIEKKFLEGKYINHLFAGHLDHDNNLMTRIWRKLTDININSTSSMFAMI